jgi:hypothetical protein
MKRKELKLLIFVVVLLFGVVNTVQGDDDGPQQSTTGPVPPLSVIAEDMLKKLEKPVQILAQFTVVGVPEYNWRHGCGPTAIGMVVGYYDTHGYDDLIPGDANTQTASVDQAIASGGTTGSPNPPGSELHYEDYAVPEDDTTPTILTDDCITKGRTPHTDDSVADYMDTSKSTRNNRYGWSWSSDVCPAFTGYVNQQNSTYSPTCTEYQWSTGALTWSVLTNEIDNGRPMVFLVDSDGDGSTDHFVTVIGYDDSSPHKYGCYDTWASSPGIRWEQFRGMSSSYSWGIWGGWTFSLAGWNPTQVIKWEQPPDETSNGIDIRCDRSDGIQRTVADDFECTTTGPINKVTFWGSWKSDIKGQIQTIHLSIHSNNPFGPYGWSEPNELLWEKDFAVGDFNETLYKYDEPESFWDPTMGTPISLYEHYQIWQYDITIDSADAFAQQGDPCNPVTYWLDIWVDLVPDAQSPQFGWKTSIMHWEDDAVYWDNSLPGWRELRYPTEHPLANDSIDMSFRIITGQEEEPNEPAVKYVQLPDLGTTGVDVDATKDTSGSSQWGPQILADDFLCTTTGAITDIHVWGSWYHDYLPSNGPNSVDFTLSIHEDLPVGDPCNPYDYSIPGKTLWVRDFAAGDYSASIEAADISEGYYVPCAPYYESYADWTCYRYDFEIDPLDAFIQQGDPCEPVVYWLDVQAKVYSVNQERFGWKTSLEHWNDDAVWALGDEDNHGPWQELRYPSGHPLYGDSIDLAFAITTGPTEQPGKPLMPHTKWSQPPVEVDPSSDVPIYCGWDELSYKTYQAADPNWKIVADDFRCLGTMPVTSIHWWGSFFDWESWASGTLPAVLPDAWWIGFWSNVPQGPLPYSYPDVLLHDFTVPANRVTIKEVGSDEYFGYYPYDLCYQLNVDLEPNEVFWQDEFREMTQNDIYWISIVALYQNDLNVDHPWGWKTRPWSWMDDAVRFQTTIDPAVGYMTDPLTITPLTDPVFQESFDVSFELDTDPNYIKWEQLYTGIRNWPHYEDVDSTLNMMDPLNERLAVDDWQCRTLRPITAIVWWGSYIGYRYEACSYGPFMALPTPPDRFHLQIWTDVPAGADPCYAYSHPNDVIWAYDVYDYDEVLVGYDKHPHGEPNEPVFRYSVRLPQDMWFIQEDQNGVFWLSVQAVYDTQDPIYRWGWTNHAHAYNDDAVQGHTDIPSGQWIWDELYDQTGASEDMSFMLFTDPDECYAGQPDYSEWVTVGKPTCWCYPRQCYGDADGHSEGKGSYWVFTADLNTMLTAWSKTAGALTGNDACADFDHLPEGKGSYRVFTADLNILLANWGTNATPADCPPGNMSP